MSDKGERQAISKFANQSELGRTLQAESQGVPQLRRRERLQLLGQFRERVLWGITKQGIEPKTVHQSFIAALDGQDVERLLVRADSTSKAMHYVQAAVKKGIPFTFVQSPEFTGDVAMVLVAAQAHDQKDDPIVG